MQRELGLDEEGAYRAMQRESRQRRKTMREIAEAIILNDDLKRTRVDEKKAARKETILSQMNSETGEGSIGAPQTESGR